MGLKRVIPRGSVSVATPHPLLPLTSGVWAEPASFPQCREVWRQNCLLSDGPVTSLTTFHEFAHIPRHSRPNAEPGPVPARGGGRCRCPHGVRSASCCTLAAPVCTLPGLYTHQGRDCVSCVPQHPALALRTDGRCVLNEGRKEGKGQRRELV